MEIIENLEVLLSILGTILSLLLTSIVCLVKAIQKGKEKRSIEANTIFLEALAPLMEIAEKYENYTGEEKKAFVLTKMNQLAIENHLKFNAEEVSKKIEELIVLSKEVNNKNKGEKK